MVPGKGKGCLVGSSACALLTSLVFALALPGCLTEAELRASRGGVPERWGIFPRVVLALMDELGSEAGASIHASAIEVYQNDAYDLLADRVPLRVGGSKKCVSPCFGIVCGIGSVAIAAWGGCVWGASST